MATEGALAPDPLARVMPARVEAVRDIPGRRKKEPAWKDEVRQRVRQRRAQRLGAELPLFPDPPAEPAHEGVLDADLELNPPTAAPELDAAVPAAEPAEGPRLVWSMPEVKEALQPKALVLDPVAEPVATERWSLGDAVDHELGSAPEPSFDEPPAHAPAASDPEIWGAEAVSPVERPAQWNDRLQAAAFDLGLLISLWAVVIYFASRAARVSVDGLWVSWPYLVGYLAFLGIVYAVYFTGTCGRTVGKIVCGLKVVDVVGLPPTYPVAFARVVLGTLGTLVAGLGLLPIFFDPARRAAHDRLLRTRVVKY